MKFRGPNICQDVQAMFAKTTVEQKNRTTQARWTATGLPGQEDSRTTIMDCEVENYRVVWTAGVLHRTVGHNWVATRQLDSQIVVARLNGQICWFARIGCRDTWMIADFLSLDTLEGCDKEKKMF